jgi:CPA1 family monovalent cation:H+ antiporter
VADLAAIFTGLLVAVSVLGWLANRIAIPYPILLVLGGLGIGLIPGLPRIHINPEIIFTFFLPPLLFPAALFMPWRDFRTNIRPILLLAIGLVLFTTVAVGWLGHYFLGLPLAAAIVLGAIISPPDAIAATAIAERLSVPRRIVAVLKGESLVNDATALVAYRFGVAAVVTGAFSLWHSVEAFFGVAIGGVAIGLAVGWLAALFHTHVDDAPVEVTFSLLTPYVAYLTAERLHASGVLAVVSAGLFLGWRTPEITSSSTRLEGGPFWEMIEFLLNGFVFILIGFKLPDALRGLKGFSLEQLIGYALGMSAAVILIRILWVFPATYLPRLFFRSVRARDPYPRWQHVMIVAWTGMRGVVSLAAALSLPFSTDSGAAFPGRNLILFLTFVVILATLVVQGLSLPFLIRWLGIEDDFAEAKEELEARLKANRAAMERLEQLAHDDPSRADALDRILGEYQARVHHLENSRGAELKARPSLFSTEYEKLSSEALEIERETILHLRNENIINDEVLRRIQHDIDLAEARLMRT